MAELKKIIHIQKIKDGVEGDYNGFYAYTDLRVEEIKSIKGVSIVFADSDSGLGKIYVYIDLRYDLGEIIREVTALAIEKHKAATNGQ